MRIEEHFPLENHNTFRLPVKARWFIEYDNEDELLRILRDEYFRECDSIHIGSGSNLLFLNDYNGIILHSTIKGVNIEEETDQAVILRIGAAEIWDDIAAFAISRGWYGAENLSGIPGECGAAAVQNIGAYGVELKDIIQSVEACDRNTCEKHIFSREDCRYSYRYSRFKDESATPYIITHIRIRLSKSPAFTLHYSGLMEQIVARHPGIILPGVRETILSIRKEKLPDPAQYGNAGSFFMNPVITVLHFEALKAAYPNIPSFPADGDMVKKVPAGWLIEQCGFRGASKGGAGVYHKQALILVNLGNASGQDIALLAEDIRTAVYKRFSITLTPEVRYIG
ncbi:MAG: UDP-N-acetylmuramate dehydrogenase [Tannerellaceae bacterium]|jgi:UDP-N-acetylmuramate dehydrogenase|nr:UDP-N-acetylmuramate dehydrogenase [Tannerellaceae bacterium]